MDNTLRFSHGRSVFRCPVCEAPLRCETNRLTCEHGHSFDISRQGYVNLAFKTKGSEQYYDKASFQSRREILNAGYYSHILEKLSQILSQLPQVVTVLDVGCGEGYYSRALAQRLSKQFLACDLSRDSIQLAARGDLSLVQWFVGDAAHLPIRSHSINCVLDVFAPANYGEFRRIMTRDGYLIKVIPGNNHLQQLRQLAKEHLIRQSYSNQSVIDYFARHFELLKTVTVSQTFPMPLAHRESFAQMTPLLFHIDRSQIDVSQISSLTIEGEILVGRPFDKDEPADRNRRKKPPQAKKKKRKRSPGA